METNIATDTPKRAAEPKADTSNKNADRHQLIIFKLGHEEYGIHIDQIKEVVLTPRITRMPQTPSYIKGVANIRGNILAIVDLEEKFGMQGLTSRTQESTSHYTLVAESKEFKIGILVKEVPNTLSVSSADIDETVHVMQDAGGESYMLGIVKMNDRLIILIDLFKAMQADELSGVLKEAVVNT